jgi:hypothetical protein
LELVEDVRGDFANGSISGIDQNVGLTVGRSSLLQQRLDLCQGIGIVQEGTM